MNNCYYLLSWCPRCPPGGRDVMQSSHHVIKPCYCYTTANNYETFITQYANLHYMKRL